MFSEDAKPELPSSGTLAKSSKANFGGSSDGPWGGIDLDGKNVNPLIASVQRVSEREFSYTVKNNSEDNYSTTLKLVSYDSRGKRIRSVPASVSLRPGQSVTRKVRASSTVSSMEVEMSSFKKKATKESKGDLEEQIKEKRKELSDLEAQLVTGSETK